MCYPLGYAPIGARDEPISSVPYHHLKGLDLEEIAIPNGSKSSLSGIIVRSSKRRQQPLAILVYFQGNAGNPLHRLPVFQALISSQSGRSTHPPIDIVAVAPRSYWKSTPQRPTQTGIISDYHRVLDYTLDRYPSTPVILYGHSLGGAISVCLTSTMTTSPDSKRENEYFDPRYKYIKGLILENPFTSIPDMVRALYPQKWVPYKYLAPLAFDKWDALSAMRSAAPPTVLDTLKPNVMVVVSEKDEVVPPEMSHHLADAIGLAPNSRHLCRTVVILDALHENAWQQRQWTTQMTRYIDDIIRDA